MGNGGVPLRQHVGRHVAVEVIEHRFHRLHRGLQIGVDFHVHARAGEGGSVIEFMTYRLHDHTTADDARRYRDDAEVKDAWTREPFLRLRKFLTDAGLWDEAQEKAWLEECGQRVDVEINAYLETPVQPVEAMFDYLYGDMPADVLAQREAAMAHDAGGKEKRA